MVMFACCQSQTLLPPGSPHAEAWLRTAVLRISNALCSLAAGAAARGPPMWDMCCPALCTLNHAAGCIWIERPPASMVLHGAPSPPRPLPPRCWVWVMGALAWWLQMGHETGGLHLQQQIAQVTLEFGEAALQQMNQSTSNIGDSSGSSSSGNGSSNRTSSGGAGTGPGMFQRQGGGQRVHGTASRGASSTVARGRTADASTSTAGSSTRSQQQPARTASAAHAQLSIASAPAVPNQQPHPLPRPRAALSVSAPTPADSLEAALDALVEAQAWLLRPGARSRTTESYL